MIDTLTLHGGPADGATYPVRDDEPIPVELQLSIRMPLPHGRIEDLPRALINGEIHAVHQYRHTGGGNYQYQEPDATAQPCPVCDGTGGDHQIGCQP